MGPGNRRRWTWVALALALALAPGAARAQCYKFNGGCSTYPQQCFPSAAGPTLYFDGSASQIRIAADSPESTCHPPVTFGPPACCSSPPPASSQPRLSNLRAVLVKNAGQHRHLRGLGRLRRA
jgi:hypothetical protein